MLTASRAELESRRPGFGPSRPGYGLPESHALLPTERKLLEEFLDWHGLGARQQPTVAFCAALVWKSAGLQAAFGFVEAVAEDPGIWEGR